MTTSNEWELVLCTGAEHLEKEFVRSGFNVTKSERNYDGSRKFANSDVYTRISPIDRLQGKRICVVQSFTCSGEKSSHNFTSADRFFEVLQVLDILAKPRKVEYLAPTNLHFRELQPPQEIVVLALHLPCSKQDKIYHTGESNSCHTAIRTMLSSGATRIVAIDPHVPSDFTWFRQFIQEQRVEVLSMYSRVKEEMLRRPQFESAVFVSTPGKRRDTTAQDLGAIDKERVSTTEVLMTGQVPEELRGKVVVLFDDMVISGTTVRKVRKILLAQEVAEVYCWITHALPYEHENEENLRRLVKEFEQKVYVSNTVRSHTFQKLFPTQSVSCVPLIIEQLLCKPIPKRQ